MRRGATSTLMATTVAFLLAGCGGTAPAPPPATVTVQVPAPAVTEIAPPEPVIVTLPDVVGQNGAIAEDTLRGVGLTKIELAADAKSGRQLVINPAD